MFGAATFIANDHLQEVVLWGMQNAREMLGAEALLKAFSRLPAPRQNPKTLLEIAGMQWREVPLTRILAFFLDPREEHGFGDLVLRSLLTAASFDTPAVPFSVEEVLLELPTDARNRIDLVVIGSDFLVAVENKLGHHAENNPFDDYYAHLKMLARVRGIPAERMLKILLCVEPPKSTLNTHGFRVATYNHFFKEIEGGLVPVVRKPSDKNIVYLSDFMETIRRSEFPTKEDSAFVEFLKFHELEAYKLFARTKSAIDRLHAIADAVFSRITFPSAFEPGKDRMASPDVGFFYSTFYADFRFSSRLTLRVEATVRLTGWQIYIWVPKGSLDDAAASLKAMKVRNFRISDGTLDFASLPVDDVDKVSQTYQLLLDAISRKSKAVSVARVARAVSAA